MNSMSPSTSRNGMQKKNDKLNAAETMTCQMCDLPKNMLEDIDGVSTKKIFGFQEYT